MLRRSGALLIALALALSMSASPLADAKKSYADLDYEGCVSVLGPALSALHGSARAHAELYFGLCQFALGREADARGHLALALRLDPSLKAPPNASPKERELFESAVRTAAAAPHPAPSHPPPRHGESPPPDAPTAEAEPTPPVAAPAPEQTLQPAPAPPPTPPPTPPPAVEAVTAPVRPARSPALPIVLTVVAAAAGGTGLGFGISARHFESQGIAEQVQVPAGALLQQAQWRALVANVCFGVAGAAAVVALISGLWILLSG
jgi:hypothetical protein